MAEGTEGFRARVAESFGLGRRELVAFVGAGGKKTTAYALCRAASTDGRRAGYTTTTQSPPAEFPFFSAPASTLSAAVREQLHTHGSPVGFAAKELSNPQRADRKFDGYAPEAISALFADGPLDWVFVKADGARRREFKAPAQNEPVIPSATTLVVPVVSMKAIGEPLGSERIHRPERITAITGTGAGDTITTDTVGQVLASEEGGLKDIPPDARVIVLCNKADTPGERALAREVLAAVWDRTDRIECGLITSFTETFCERVVPPEGYV